MGLFGAAGAALGGSSNRNSRNGGGISSFANSGGGISGVIGNMFRANMQNSNVQNATQMTGTQNPGVNLSSLANSGGGISGAVGNMVQANLQNRSNGAGNQIGEAILMGTPEQGTGQVSAFNANGMQSYNPQYQNITQQPPVSKINAQIPVGQGPIAAVDQAASVDPSQVQSTFSPASQDAASMMFGTQIDGSFGRQMY